MQLFGAVIKKKKKEPQTFFIFYLVNKLSSFPAKRCCDVLNLGKPKNRLNRVHFLKGESRHCDWWVSTSNRALRFDILN